MKKLSFALLLVSISFFMSCDATKKTATTVDSKSVDLAKPAMSATPGTIAFTAANNRYSAAGDFKKWDFTKVSMDGKDITSLNASLTIDLTSIWEKSDKLTAHLKADDYFGVSQYTTATMDIMNINSIGGDRYSADMVLKMRGKTQKMKSEFMVTSKSPLKVKGSAQVDRRLFGIGVDNTDVPDLITVTYDTAIPKM